MRSDNLNFRSDTIPWTLSISSGGVTIEEKVALETFLLSSISFPIENTDK